MLAKTGLFKNFHPQHKSFVLISDAWGAASLNPSGSEGSGVANTILIESVGGSIPGGLEAR